jgi:hypothetical protein
MLHLKSYSYTSTMHDPCCGRVAQNSWTTNSRAGERGKAHCSKLSCPKCLPLETLEEEWSTPRERLALLDVDLGLRHQIGAFEGMQGDFTVLLIAGCDMNRLSF